MSNFTLKSKSRLLSYSFATFMYDALKYEYEQMQLLLFNLNPISKYNNFFLFCNT